MNNNKQTTIIIGIFLIVVIQVFLFIWDYAANNKTEDIQEQIKAFNNLDNIICPTSLGPQRVIINKNDGYEIFKSNDEVYYKQDKVLYAASQCFVQK